MSTKSAKPKPKKQPQPLDYGPSHAPVCEPGRVGWWALQHRDGWWVGTDRGVNCYNTHEFARVALTILWQREGGGAINYRVKRFTGANIVAGDFTPKKTAEQAIKDYEANTPTTRAAYNPYPQLHPKL